MRSVQKNILILLKEHSVRKRLAIAVCLFALVMVFAVFWSLRISGLTLEEKDATETSATETDSDATGTDGEEETTSSTTNTSSSKVRTMLTATNSTYYYFVDPVTAETALSNQGEEYVIYTEIDGKYYLVDAEGNLILWDFTTSSDGSYYWTADGTISNYEWQISDDSSASDSYYLYNAENGTYLSPSDEKTIKSTSSVWTAADNDTDYKLADDETIIYTITCTDSNTSSANFGVEVYDDTSHYVSTGSELNGWLWPSNSSGTVDVNINDGKQNENEFTAGSTYVVWVTRRDADYTFTYYDAVNEVVKMVVTATDTELSGDVNVHFSPGVGTYTVKVEYASTEVTQTTTSYYNTVYGTDTTIDTFQSSSADSETLSGDFNVTYTFHNVSLSNDNYDNFVIRIDNSSNSSVRDGWVYLRADCYGWTESVNSNDNDYDITISNIDWTNWVSTMQAGVDCTVNIIRSGNTFTFTVTILDSSSSTVASFTAEVTDDTFNSCDATIYLTGEECTLSNVVFTDYTTELYSTTLSYTADPIYVDNFKNYTTSQQSTKVTPVSSGSSDWTAVRSTTNMTWNMFAEYSSSITSVEWMESGGEYCTNENASATLSSLTSGSSTTTSMKLRFASVRSFTAYFDGTNDSVYSCYPSGYTSSIMQKTVTTNSFDSTGAIAYITVPNVYLYDNNNARYDYTLDGWFDIYTATYYDASYGDEIEFTYDTAKGGAQYTVLYGDWIADSIDGGSTSATGYSSSGADTGNFVSINMFDYNDDYDKIALN